MSGLSEVRIHGIGDSLTVGIADVCTNRRLRAWPHLLARALRDAGMPAAVTCDLAKSGAPAAEVYVEQFSLLDLRPGDLVCLWTGANDAILRRCTYANTHAAITAMFDQIEGAGCVPLTMEMPRISAMLPGPARLMGRWDDFGAAVNELVSARSARVGGVHVPWRTAPGITGPDGAHLSAYGHQVYANEYAVQLAARWEMEQHTVREAVPGAVRHGTRWPWYLRNGVPWLWRRQFDPPRPIPAVMQDVGRSDVVERAAAAGAGGEPRRARAAVGRE